MSSGLKTAILLLCWLVYLPASRANNVQISHVQMLGSSQLRFDISWENSWKLENVQPPYNHDAIWIFVKWRASNGDWQHASLSTDSSVYTLSGDISLETVKDGKGVFIRRQSAGSGTVSGTVILRMAGYVPSSGNYDFRVQGIEMVYVNTGDYYLGDGRSYNHFRRGDIDAPLYIRSEDEIALSHDSLSLNDTGQYAPSAAIPSAYPKGYHGFYCMKYEIGQEQYAMFLNTLTYMQQKARTTTSPDAAAGTYAFSSGYANRNGIAIETPGKATSKPAIYACQAVSDNVFNNADDGQNRSCNFLSWADVASYLDWAALRPMTELEFEKTCRGPLLPVQQEFAWGTAYVTDANTLTADGTDSEHVTDVPPAGYGLASHGYSGPQGGLRCGFAANDTSGRIYSGSSYYGAMEMSGDLWEICVTVNKTGLTFRGQPGDGNLTAEGAADVQNWPGADANGMGYRGGGWNSGIQSPFRDLAASDRFYAGLQLNLRRNTGGGRGVR